VLVLAFAAGVILTRFFRQVRDLPQNEDPFRARSETALRRQMRTTKIMLIVLTACLFGGLWETRHDPILPRVGALGISLALIVGTARGLRNGRAKLKQFEDRRTP
jgi:Na+/H+ antiporter NhaD/arsenite permease-like protein